MIQLAPDPRALALQILDLALALQPLAVLLAGLTAAALALSGRLRRALLAAALAAGLAAGLGPVWSAPGPARTADRHGAVEMTLVAANLRRDSRLGPAAVRALLETAPDALLLIETPPELDAEFAALAAAGGLSHVHRGRSAWMRLAAATRTHAARPAAPPPRTALTPAYLALDLDLSAPGAPPLPLRVIAMHLASPLAPVHAAQRDQIPALAPLRRARMAVAGDLNAPPWGRAPAALATALDLRLAPGYRPSWLPRLGPLAPLTDALRPWLGLPIDHALVSEGVEILSLDTLAVPGSDHLAQVIRVRVTPPPAPSAALSAPSSPRRPSAPSR